MDDNMKYYNAGETTGVVGTYPAHEDGNYTFLPSHWASNPWIRTEDLYDTRKEAEKASKARFL